ncbi:MAG: branched-chain amino acid ABC transporter permease [Candidatus Thermofonsia Clade 1 bacterium]|uniref:Branched-chain amino acid ABC transporter permease n=1 Tax=Candidatus Thermofonsia Clade 1 bacterium TaxID=2364210 RepID=A0A2M8PB11_9CHLR|nr:MAG: branched-chain amino acid ABC transporter permease [Candidatus Thermofonsia Clade 1 bacterium]
MSEFLLVVGMALVTFAARYPVLAFFGRLNPRPYVLSALKFVPPAVLSAIIAPSMLMPEGALDLQPRNAFLVAGILAALIAWRTKNLLLTIFLGMAALWLWRAVMGAL